MEFLHDLEELKSLGSRLPMVLTIGVFDGVHVAHRALISGAVISARELGVKAAVLSFSPHPDTVIRPNQKMIYLTDLTDKAALVAEIGADILIVQPFTPEFARIPAEDFVVRLTTLTDLREIHVGEDFVFGYKAGGNVVRLRQMGIEHGFQVKSLAPVEMAGAEVKSSRIRQFIGEGDVAQAGKLLARAYSLKGEVISGFRRGHTIGYPTANIAIPPDFAVPGNGVYATMTTLLDGDSHALPRPSVTNIGTRPTFDDGARSVETFILDWDGDLYGKHIRVEFIQKLRDERKFNGIEELKAQLAQDVEAARAALKKAGRS